MLFLETRETLTAHEEPLAAPLRIACLGGFAAFRNGAPFAVPAKPPLPLELLQRVVAAGPRGAPRERLFAQLWSGLEYPTAHFAAAHRVLARGLRVPHVLTLTADTVGIDGDVVAVDALVLEAALEPLLMPGDRATPAQREAAAVLLRGYAPFLPERNEPWAVVARLRLRDQVRRAGVWLALPAEER